MTHIAENPIPSSNDLIARLEKAVELDIWPDFEVIDAFGLESTRHLEALYTGVKSGGLTRPQLAEACGTASRLNDFLPNIPEVVQKFEGSQLPRFSDD